MQHTRTCILMGLVSLALGFSVGCSKPMSKAYNITITLDQEMAQDMVEVDLVCIGSLEREEWGQLSMTDYFKKNNPRRSATDNNVVTFKFPPGKHDTQTLSKNDPVWQKWLRKDKYNLELFVLAFLPGQHDDKPYGADPRRLILPVRSDRWESETIDISVNKGTVKPVRSPLPPKD